MTNTTTTDSSFTMTEAMKRLNEYCADNGIKIIKECLDKHCFIFHMDKKILYVDYSITDKQIEIFIEHHEEQVKSAA